MFLQQSPEHLLCPIVSALRQQLIKPDGRSRKSGFLWFGQRGTNRTSSRKVLLLPIALVVGRSSSSSSSPTSFSAFSTWLTTSSRRRTWSPSWPPAVAGRLRMSGSALGLCGRHNTVKTRRLAGGRLIALPRRRWRRYSHAVLHPHQADAVDGQDAVARLQLAAASGGRLGDHRLDVNAAHLQLSFLSRRKKEKINFAPTLRSAPWWMIAESQSSLQGSF